LVERLNKAVRLGHRLALLSAPAGFGKTTLLGEWIGSREHEGQPPVGLHTPCFSWLSLDEGDNDPVRFWSYVVVALQTVAPDFGQDALAVLRSPTFAVPGALPPL
jgi:LuxR family maltose regulon positive regulatory protein